jgi:hypothetical protein
VYVGSSLGHPNQGLIFDKIKFFFIHCSKVHVVRLGGAAACAGFNGARILGFTKGALPDQRDKTERFSSHMSSGVN